MSKGNNSRRNNCILILHNKLVLLYSYGRGNILIFHFLLIVHSIVLQWHNFFLYFRYNCIFHCFWYDVKSNGIWSSFNDQFLCYIERDYYENGHHCHVVGYLFKNIYRRLFRKLWFIWSISTSMVCIFWKLYIKGDNKM